MPGLVQTPEAQSFTVKELHPTFAAEIRGLDLSRNVSDSTFKQILDLMSKVGNVLFTIFS